MGTKKAARVGFWLKGSAKVSGATLVDRTEGFLISGVEGLFVGRAKGLINFAKVLGKMPKRLKWGHKSLFHCFYKDIHVFSK